MNESEYNNHELDEIAGELGWLNRNVAVTGLRLDGGEMSLHEAIRLYAPTLHHAMRLRPDYGLRAGESV